MFRGRLMAAARFSIALSREANIGSREKFHHIEIVKRRF